MSVCVCVCVWGGGGMVSSFAGAWKRNSSQKDVSLELTSIETRGLYFKFSYQFNFMFENRVIELTTLLLDELRQ